MKLLATICILSFLNYSCMQPCKIDSSLKEQALNELHAVLKNNTMWVKVHAAEYLIWLHKDIEEVQKVYLNEYALYQKEPKYRVGISRILNQAASTPEQKKEWVDKVLRIFGDTTAPDRIHAAETLAKLKVSPETAFPDVTQVTLNDTNRILQTYTRWATSYSSKQAADANKKIFTDLAFTDQDSIIRKISAYVLMKSKELSPEEWKSFTSKAFTEPASSGLRNNLLNTAFVTYTGGEEETFKKIKTEMTSGWQQFTPTQRIELAQALAENGGCEDIPLLSAYLNNKENNGVYDAQSPLGADIRAAAAFAILKIAERENK